MSCTLRSQTLIVWWNLYVWYCCFLYFLLCMWIFAELGVTWTFLFIFSRKSDSIVRGNIFYIDTLVDLILWFFCFFQRLEIFDWIPIMHMLHNVHWENEALKVGCQYRRKCKNQVEYGMDDSTTNLLILSFKFNYDILKKTEAVF